MYTRNDQNADYVQNINTAQKALWTTHGLRPGSRKQEKRAAGQAGGGTGQEHTGPGNQDTAAE